MEANQVLLIVIITILTIILTVIGIQLFFILKEVRKSFQKVNKMLDDGTLISSACAKSVTGISGLLAGVRAGLSFVNFFKRDRKEENGEKE